MQETLVGLAWRQNDNVQATERALKGNRGGLIFFFPFVQHFFYVSILCFCIFPAVSIFLLFGSIETSPLCIPVSGWTYEERTRRKIWFLFRRFCISYSLAAAVGVRVTCVRNGMQTTNDMVMSSTVYKKIDPIVWTRRPKGVVSLYWLGAEETGCTHGRLFKIVTRQPNLFFFFPVSTGPCWEFVLYWVVYILS